MIKFVMQHKIGAASIALVLFWDLFLLARICFD
jgi:hypothetical protein